MQRYGRGIEGRERERESARERDMKSCSRPSPVV